MHAAMLTTFGVFIRLPLCAGNRREHHGEVLREVAAVADAGRLQPRHGLSEYTLSQIEAARAAVESGTATGKVVITIS